MAVVGVTGDKGLNMFCEGSTSARVEFWGWTDRYSRREGWTLENASDTLGGIDVESLGVFATLNVGDVSRGGLSAEEVEGDEIISVAGVPSAVVLMLDGLGFLFLVNSLDDITRVCPPNIASREAVISASGPIFS